MFLHIFKIFGHVRRLASLLFQVPQQNICRHIAGNGKRLGQELGVDLLGEVSVFMGEHFRDDIHAELAAVGEADGEVMPQSVEQAEVLGKSGCYVEASTAGIIVYSYRAKFIDDIVWRKSMSDSILPLVW